ASVVANPARAAALGAGAAGNVAMASSGCIGISRVVAGDDPHARTLPHRSPAACATAFMWHATCSTLNFSPREPERAMEHKKLARRALITFKAMCCGAVACVFLFEMSAA